MVPDNKVQKLQQVELSILTEVVRYCEKKSIQYYLAFGTLLGAVRHQGFIPWDDDVDIFMKREDYNRFLAEAEKDLPDWLEIRTYHNTRIEEGYLAFQGKVESRRHFVIRQLGDKQARYRVWIDIFPLDGMPENSFFRKLHYYNIALHFAACRIANTAAGYKPSEMRKRSRRIQSRLIEFTHIRKLLKPEKTFQALTDVLSKYPFGHSPYVIGYTFAYRDRTIVPGSCFGDGKSAPFENLMLTVPDDSETLLKSWYGDYMRLPPESRQKPRHCIDIIVE